MTTALLPPIATSASPASPDPQLVSKIRQLSVEAIIAGVFVCTSCGEATGRYIITHQGHKFSYNAQDTYAFLKSMTFE